MCLEKCIHVTGAKQDCIMYAERDDVFSYGTCLNKVNNTVYI